MLGNSCNYLTKVRFSFKFIVNSKVLYINPEKITKTVTKVLTYNYTSEITKLPEVTQLFGSYQKLPNYSTS